MPITLTQMVNNTAHISFPCAGDNVQLTYYPSRVTERFFAVFQTANNMDVLDGFKEFNALLAGVIKDWDVYATAEDMANNQPFPLDPDRFPELPIELRMQAYGAILGAIRPEAMASQTIQN